MTDSAPTFPPLMSGVAVEGGIDPFDKARSMAALGCDAGTVVHNIQVDRLRAAIVFAPEVALEQAMAMLPVCGVGFQNALGALAPPEVAVHLEWQGGIRVNNASCGRLRAASSTTDPGALPDWLVIGLDLPLLQTATDPGATPDVTSLYDEGCADVDPVQLIESWARHTLVWVNRWEDDGNRPLHAEWMGLLHGVGDPITMMGRQGRFLGVDDQFGMLIRDDETTHLIPLSQVLED
ncbi:biotin/lipoate--protein ligase family protein [Aestuariivita boseongensis]|uniref:biotin/lipoate--protein ligase family protein n=1 Tax=Aestuariivita boseongensis TaxID=1470562 RepID=UPI00068204F8|nr:biotin/lipoate--protein ligase family protein [Aestuariivita boseongensis]